jgi:hypothetical protein
VAKRRGVGVSRSNTGEARKLGLLRMQKFRSRTRAIGAAGANERVCGGWSDTPANDEAARRGNLRPPTANRAAPMGRLVKTVASPECSLLSHVLHSVDYRQSQWVSVPQEDHGRHCFLTLPAVFPQQCAPREPKTPYPSGPPSPLPQGPLYPGTRSCNPVS